MMNRYLHRLSRLVTHLGHPLVLSAGRFTLPYENILIWFGDLIFSFLDVLLVPEFYMMILVIIRRKFCRLSDRQVDLARPYFGASVDYAKVRLYSDLSNYMRKRAYAYVSLNVINYKDQLRDDVLIHELVHIWQYQRFGSPYIFRALLAQLSKEGYDYGGVQNLYSGMMSGKRFVDFNFEQQGDIIQHAFVKDHAHDGFSTPFESAVYQYYIDQVKYEVLSTS